MLLITDLSGRIDALVELERATGNHPVDVVCSNHDITHRLTRIRRPQTNGMVERFNRRVNEAISTKQKTSNNGGRNSFYSHEERNEFIKKVF